MKTHTADGMLTRAALALGYRDKRLDLYGGKHGMYALTPDGHHDVELEMRQRSTEYLVQARDAVSGQTLFLVSLNTLQEARATFRSRVSDTILQLQSGNFPGAIIESAFHTKSEFRVLPGSR